MQGALVGGTGGAPPMQQDVGMLAREQVRGALYRSAGVIAAAKSQLLSVLGQLTEIEGQAKLTKEFIESDGMVRLEGMHVTKAVLVEKLGLVTADDVAILSEVLTLLRAACEGLPLHATELAANKMQATDTREAVRRAVAGEE